jgi:hypothetical protein
MDDTRRRQLGLKVKKTYEKVWNPIPIETEVYKKPLDTVKDVGMPFQVVMEKGVRDSGKSWVGMPRPLIRIDN